MLSKNFYIIYKYIFLLTVKCVIISKVLNMFDFAHHELLIIIINNY